jgi:hypothetical protein
MRIPINMIALPAAAAICGCLSMGVAAPAIAASLLNAIPGAAAPAPKLAAVFELKLRLPEGRGLARLLLDAGVGREDAAAAARLAAGHLGDGLGGCEAKVAISRPVQGGAGDLQLERLVLMSRSGQVIIERRGGELTVADGQGSARTLSGLI